MGASSLPYPVAKDSRAQIPQSQQQKPTGVAPSKILFIQNLPQQINQDLLRKTFAACPGMNDLRVVPGNYYVDNIMILS